MRIAFLLISLLTISAAVGNDNLKFGTPGGEGQLINYTGFTLLYSENLEQPLWVSYILTKDELENPVCERQDNFRKDPLVKTGSAILSDYKGNGIYDRGHLAPAADMKWSKKAMSDSFRLSNISPQHYAMNRGMWCDMEIAVRGFARKEGAVCIITGPIIKPGFKTIGANKVAVPQAYYKIVYSHKSKKVLAFIIPNEKPKKKFKDYVVSVDYIERMTGLDFLDKLPDALEDKLEKKTDLNLWLNTDESPKGKGGKYSISNSGKRHNSGCRYYNSKRSTKVKKGIACKVCGG